MNAQFAAMKAALQARKKGSSEEVGEKAVSGKIESEGEPVHKKPSPKTKAKKATGAVYWPSSKKK